MIEIQHLTKKYKDVVAVNGISFTLKENQIFALLGLNGAGKSTLIKMLVGLVHPDSGDAIIDGKLLSKERDEIKKVVGISPQDSALGMNLTVKENLYFVAELYKLKKEEKERKVQELIEYFELTEVVNKKGKALSGGYKRRLSIAMALLQNPKIIFLDEPTLGLDVISRRKLWELIVKLKKDHLIVLCTHYMDEAEHLADNLGIICKGNLLLTSTVQECLTKMGKETLEDAFLECVRRYESGSNI